MEFPVIADFNGLISRVVPSVVNPKNSQNDCGHRCEGQPSAIEAISQAFVTTDLQFSDQHGRMTF
jgi:hypothetical protein